MCSCGFSIWILGDLFHGNYISAFSNGDTFKGSFFKFTRIFSDEVIHHLFLYKAIFVLNRERNYCPSFFSFLLATKQITPGDNKVHDIYNKLFI